jgi:hypothetical protein
MTLQQLLDSFRQAAAVFSRGGSAYRGVSWHKSSGKWRARLTVDGKQKEVYTGDSELEAARAFDAAAFKLHGRCATAAPKCVLLHVLFS